MQDPNKPMLRIYEVPVDAFEVNYAENDKDEEEVEVRAVWVVLCMQPRVLTMLTTGGGRGGGVMLAFVFLCNSTTLRPVFVIL